MGWHRVESVGQAPEKMPALYPIDNERETF